MELDDILLNEENQALRKILYDPLYMESNEVETTKYEYFSNEDIQMMKSIFTKISWSF